MRTERELDSSWFGVASPLHGQIAIDHQTAVTSLTRMAFKSKVVDGSEPFVRGLTIDHPVAAISVLPEGALIERSCTDSLNAETLASFKKSAHILVLSQSRSTTVWVASESHARTEQLISEIEAMVPPQAFGDRTKLKSWHLANHDRAMAQDRRIETPRWADIERNYTPRVQTALSRLFETRNPTSGGNLILWHGEPGTGKTTAIRALMREWEPWCATQYVEDPEEFFSHPSYISEVLSRPITPDSGPSLTSAGNPVSKWRLVIAEDADQYLRASARRDSGAALGKLLNLADGILGQGLNTLILLTTNEELNRLHPAIIRPGRCLARVEFDKFTPSEAKAWLPVGAKAPVTDSTLAEMFEASGTIERIDAEQRVETCTTGQYL